MTIYFYIKVVIKDITKVQSILPNDLLSSGIGPHCDKLILPRAASLMGHCCAQKKQHISYLYLSSAVNLSWNVKINHTSSINSLKALQKLLITNKRQFCD